MKKISNEVKVGGIALLTLIVFVWLFDFLKGKDFLKTTDTYYSVYDKVGGLAESSPVEINGYKVGVVRSIDFIDATSGRLLVVFSVSKNFKLPRNTVAEIVPVSILGGMKVQFIYGKGPGTYVEGDTIPGRLAESLTDKIDTEILPVKEKMANLIVALDSVIVSIGDVMNPQFKKAFAGTMDHLNNTSASLDKVLGAKQKELSAIVENINKFTKMLSDNSEKMGNTFGKLETIADTLNASDVHASVTKLKASLENAASLMEKLNNGKGSAGQFLTNDTLYTNLTSSLESLNVLLKDMKTNPKRYVHFSIFGKKNTPSK
jgi:ABC-type transport system involved in resistance to organic solvents, periplasmic component